MSTIQHCVTNTNGTCVMPFALVQAVWHEHDKGGRSARAGGPDTRCNLARLT